MCLLSRGNYRNTQNIAWTAPALNGRGVGVMRLTAEGRLTARGRLTVGGGGGGVQF